jgi:site-specific recombinase XerD
MDKASRVRVTGPLASYAPGFRKELAAQGYTTLSATNQLRLLAHVSRWLAGKELDAGGLTPERVEEFLRARRAEGYVCWRSAQGLVPLLEFLGRLGVVPVPAAATPTPAEELVERYRQYLVSERGLSAATVRRYQCAASVFLAAWEQGGLELEGLTAADVSRFVLGECARRSVGSVKSMVSELRSLLRFLHLEGMTPVSLTGVVPAATAWSVGSLPRAIDVGAVARLLASCDRRTSTGRRDFAVLLVRLGMRAGEVAALELGDVDWRRGEIVVRGKRSRLERLPLPVDVGEALAGYVRRGRPRIGLPALFLRVKAPQGALNSPGVRRIVRAACGRAGLPSMGAHRLRHTAATELPRQGAALPEIGQLLRHRSIDTTAIYAKVDTEALRALARPWPGGAA